MPPTRTMTCLSTQVRSTSCCRTRRSASSPRPPQRSLSMRCFSPFPPLDLVVPPPRRGGLPPTQDAGRLIPARVRWEDILRAFRHVVAESRSSAHVWPVHGDRIDAFLQERKLVLLTKKAGGLISHPTDRKDGLFVGRSCRMVFRWSSIGRACGPPRRTWPGAPTRR